MDFSRKGAAGFAVGVTVRAALMGVLAFGAVLAASHQKYASALILAGAMMVCAIDLARSSEAADRLLAQFVDGMIAEGYERPAAAAGVGQLAEAIKRALDRLGRARAERQQRIDQLEAMADNVVAALVVVDDAGTVVLANRAARARLGEVSGSFEKIAALGPAAKQLLDLPPGARDIVRLADGRSMLAQTASFSAPAAGRRRLISLQSVSDDLGAVEVKAWQDLVRVLAHEMMNSLTPICSLSESIAARVRAGVDGGADDIAEAVEVIARRSAGLMSFVERYRKLADLPPAAKTAVAMDELAARLERLMAASAKTAGARYESRVTPSNLEIDADPDLLEQALINLLKNALDAVRGRPDAAVALTCAVDGDHVAIAVEDNGPGLATDDPELAFVPFYTTKKEGSGVGLTLSRQIAQAHGGRLEHLRRAPHGAVFRLLLPREP
jgi:nitrogen fixation/metabolism regulation signal transduction histidine kinase